MKIKNRKVRKNAVKAEVVGEILNATALLVLLSLLWLMWVILPAQFYSW